MVHPFTEQPTIEIRIQTRQQKTHNKISISYESYVLVGPRLPWLALGASHKPNSAKDMCNHLYY